MAHFRGEVLQNGQVRALFDYNDTVSLILPKLYLTDGELDENWRKGDTTPRCTCGQPSELVQLDHLSNGKGLWNGTACFRCMVITSSLRADDYYPE